MKKRTIETKGTGCVRSIDRGFVFKGEVIFHLAALPGLQLCAENPEEAIEVNVLGIDRSLFIVFDRIDWTMQ
jgi:nucleoside-diphosphate-sugar epimerase